MMAFIATFCFENRFPLDSDFDFFSGSEIGLDTAGTFFRMPDRSSSLSSS
jgi:hypothetical protein